MSWLKVTLKISKVELERWEAALLEVGAISVSLENDDTEAILETEMGEMPIWSRVKLTTLFPRNAATLALQRKFASELDEDTFSCELLEDKNWLTEHTKYFKPLLFNKKLCVYPSWITPPQKDFTNLLINPSLAFGTGEHPTTSMCLEILSEKPLESKTVVDFGCGSGILALAALKLKARAALGVDHDPVSIRASQENAILNNLKNNLELALPNDPEMDTWQGQADLVVANILANPLIQLAPTLMGFLKKGGTLILSGILKKQTSQLISSYSSFLQLEQNRMKQGWVVLEGTKT